MSTNTLRPTILVIVGVSGDLAKRKLLPAIARIAEAGQLPEKFRIVGISRRALTPADILRGTRLSGNRFLKEHLEIYQMNLQDGSEYAGLARHLNGVAAQLSTQTQTVFYLSVPPDVSESIIKCLGEAGFAAKRTKLLLEKPFGTNVATADRLIKTIDKYFDEKNIYRIDHFLAKEMAQNILVFRAGNSLFRHTWHKDFIEKLEIVVSESIGIEGRKVFYEQTGALRDIMQSHLLQLAALTLMELPKKDDGTDLIPLRLAALQSLRPPTRQEIAKHVRRGQYDGYRHEVGNPESTVETFVSLILFSDDPRWQGVPIKLTTGKKLDRKRTEIRIHYRRESAQEANQLILRIQPHEGIEFRLWNKRPGYNRQLEQVALDYTYQEHFESLPEAYEQVILDAARSDHHLFASSEEVKAAWRILEPVQQAWRANQDDLIMYKPGSKVAKVLESEG